MSGSEAAAGGRADRMQRVEAKAGSRRGARARHLRAVLACILVTLLGHQEAAEAQRVGSAVYPAMPQEAPAADPKLKRDYSATPPGLSIVLPPMDAAAGKGGAEKSGKRRLKIGVHRGMPDEFRGDLSSQLDWEESGDGSVFVSLSVTSPGAGAMRMGVRAVLPEGGEIRFFGDPGQGEPGLPVVGPEDFHVKGERREVPGPSTTARSASDGPGSLPPSPDSLADLSFSLKGESGGDILWSPVVEGDTIGAEITLPSDEVRPEFSFTVEKISHIPMTPGSFVYEPLRTDCFNHIDVQCPAARFPGIQADAVASILFEDDEGTYLCSGTLLNDRVDSSFVPYFLTAHHCVPSDAVAHSVEAWWFFRRATCGRVEIDERFVVTHGGASLLATSADKDSTLLRLQSRPPAGVSLSGWSADPIHHPTSVYGLHHPDGVVLKYASGATVNQRDVAVSGLGVLFDAIVVRWQSGGTEGGSSGSGLFDDLTLIGVLSGGTNQCDRGIDVYGPFRDFFPLVKHWLDPVFSHAIPFVTPASNAGQQGFVRVVNNSNRSGTVSILALDDEGVRFGPVSLSLGAGRAAHFNSGDLEEGNPSKGLSGGVGDGSGNWRLELSTALEIEVRAYMRTVDGFLTSIHDVAVEAGTQLDEGGGLPAEDEARSYHVPIFNPGGNVDQVSWLRLVNTGDRAAEVVISGTDDEGDAAPWGEVRLTLAAGAARSLSAQQLELGDSGLDGRLGTGEGKWRLSVSADRPIQVMSLMQSPTGHLTNLSR